jgi:outer membrane protein OmpA-like peptidoglycan-associated protein
MMRFSIVFGGFAFAALASAQTPQAQYSVEDIQQRYENCPKGTLRMGDGTCAPTRGFGIVRPDANADTPAKPLAVEARKEPRANYKRPAKSSPAGNRARGYDLLIGFANGSAQMTEQAKANARVFAKALQTPQLAGARFAIDGHTNAVGARDYNLGLSQSRAQAVADFLIAEGVDASRMEIHGYGFDRLSDSTSPASGTNRRVEARRLN